MPAAETGTEFWVNCRTCGHEWIAAYLPLLIATFVKIGERCICPVCGEKKDVMCGRKGSVRAGDPACSFWEKNE